MKIGLIEILGAQSIPMIGRQLKVGLCYIKLSLKLYWSYVLKPNKAMVLLSQQVCFACYFRRRDQTEKKRGGDMFVSQGPE